MILVGSCGWLEYLSDGQLADSYARYFEKIEDLVTPTIVVYEVYKKVNVNGGKKMG